MPSLYTMSQYYDRIERAGLDISDYIVLVPSRLTGDWHGSHTVEGTSAWRRFPVHSWRGRQIRSVFTPWDDDDTDYMFLPYESHAALWRGDQRAWRDLNDSHAYRRFPRIADLIAGSARARRVWDAFKPRNTRALHACLF